MIYRTGSLFTLFRQEITLYLHRHMVSLASFCQAVQFKAHEFRSRIQRAAESEIIQILVLNHGFCQIVKNSEDGKVDGINFTITGNGINQTVTTANGVKFQIDNFMPGIYTVIEQAYDKYEPQETHSVNEVWIIRKQNKELYGFLTV